MGPDLIRFKTEYPLNQIIFIKIKKIQKKYEKTVRCDKPNFDPYNWIRYTNTIFVFMLHFVHLHLVCNQYPMFPAWQSVGPDASIHLLN